MFDWCGWETAVASLFVFLGWSSSPHGETNEGRGADSLLKGAEGEVLMTIVTLCYHLERFCGRMGVSATGHVNVLEGDDRPAGGPTNGTMLVDSCFSTDHKRRNFSVSAVCPAQRLLCSRTPFFQPAEQ